MMRFAELFLIFVLPGISIASADVINPSSKGPSIIREVTSETPDSIVRHYSFPAPLRFVDIEIRYGSDRRRLVDADIRFGNGKRTVISSTLLSCFPDPHPEFLDFLYLAVDQRYPTRNDPWWASLLIPFGSKLESDSDHSDPVVPLHVYPYLEVELVNWKPARVVIHRSPKESRIVQLPSSRCPTEDIEWAIGARARLPH